MLSDSTQSARPSTRRPLPPAKARKSTLLTFAPSYTYTDDSLGETLLESPVPITTQLVDATSKTTDDIGFPSTPGVQNLMNEKSREELSELLLKADSIIKFRETELTVTAALCKSLYTDNVTLKTKHEALLARLPSSGTTSPMTSPPATQVHLHIPSIDQLSVVFPTSPDASLQPSNLAARYRRTRRVSVTPAEIASLSDQNAELIEKLEELEAESLKADQTGKRKLRKLEEEIQTLRDELEKMQRRGVELEQEARAAANATNAQRRKEKRDARLQALKERSMFEASGSALDEVKDFAPPSFLPRSSCIKRSAIDSCDLAESSIAHSPGKACIDGELPLPPDPASYFPTPPGSSVDLPPTEYEIVSKLLSKIRELEETNSEIKEQQTLTEQRVRDTQFDVESIRRVYEYLDDGDVDLKIQEEYLEALEDPGSPSPEEDTIRFSSLRKSIAGSMSRLSTSDSDVFAGGIAQNKQSTVQHAIANRIAHSKARKTVVGLFESDTDTSTESTGWGEYPPMLKVSPAFRPPPDMTPEWSSGGLTPLSPSLSISQSPLDPPALGRSLGSELGSEYGDDWAQGGINHHLRATSLYDLSGLASSPVSPTAASATLPPITLSAVYEDSIGPDLGWKSNSKTPPCTSLQLNVEPPTPSPENLRSPAAKQRQLQLSQTMRARTHRWIEGRFPPSNRQNTSNELVEISSDIASTSSSGLFRRVHTEVLEETFDNVAGRIRRVASNSFPTLPFTSGVPGSLDVYLSVSDPLPVQRRQDPEEVKEEEEADRSMTLLQDGSVTNPLASKYEGLVGYVIEAWLWLQFIVVVALFLWTMAKRGPKVVLEAERRNAHRPSTR